MRIVLDAMGSDDCPEPELAASVQAAREFEESLYLVGPVDRYKTRLEELAGKDPGILRKIELVNATDLITMEDKGMGLALKAKRKNSQTTMAIGMDLVKEGKADAFVTAGNTGGAMATAYFRLGTIPGVERPGLTGLFPVRNGYCAVVDIGANPECRPEHLVQFAIMGSIYAESVLGKKNPRVGLLSNGEEAGKGNELVKAAYPLLENCGVNFIGNVEGKELFGGAADVVVCDGFTGNVLLKSSEAVAKLLTEIIREQMMSSLRTKIGGLLAKPAFSAVKKMMDPSEIGAAPLLGVDGLVFIGHGRSDARAVYSAIKLARQSIQANLLGSIRSRIEARIQEAANDQSKTNTTGE